MKATKAAVGSRPLWVGEIDLAFPPVSLGRGSLAPNGQPYTRARLLARFRGEPVGMLTVPYLDGELDVEAVCAEAAKSFRAQIDAAGGAGWVPGRGNDADRSQVLDQPVDGDVPAISVVIGTRNRADHVVECVDRVLKQPYPSPVEVIIVENGSADGATRQVVDANYGSDDRVRYMTEARRGLSRARNIGLSAARYPITAFLSDDIRVDALWLSAIARGFARNPEVRCVTGFCPPMFLDTPEQLLFEASMAWGTRQGFEPKIYGFELASDPVHPYRAGSFVNGSNMAYHTDTFQKLGGFDESLGPGTIARGGEDLDAPIRILAQGGLIAFEPAAIGWHADRYDDRSFGAHMYTYGLGLTAFLTKHLIDREHRAALLHRIRPGSPLLLKAFGEPDDLLSGEAPVPMRYHLSHLAGRVVGPLAYLRSRSAHRR